MRTCASTLVFAVAAALAGTAAQAADGCGDFKWSVARERAAFADNSLKSIASGQDYPGLLTGVTVTLSPQTAVVYPKAPARAPKSSPAYGAVLTAPPVAQAGTYQVTLSEDAWVDLVQNGAVVRSSGFSGKTDCPGIRKTVRFPLAVGPVTIELSDSGKDHLDLDFLPAE